MTIFCKTFMMIKSLIYNLTTNVSNKQNIFRRIHSFVASSIIIKTGNKRIIITTAKIFIIALILFSYLYFINLTLPLIKFSKSHYN